MNKKTQKLSTAAVAGILVATMLSASAFAAKTKAPAQTPAATTTAAAMMCTGNNECAGKGGCATANNACAGKNTCHGHAFLAKSEADCTAKGGKIAAVAPTKADATKAAAPVTK